MRVKPFSGQAAQRSKADRIANKKCLVVLDISTNLNFFEAIAITILLKIINIY